ncbi:hypothetical protein [Xanthomonas albilineans]|uniref:hypothetical protein n=1 Tax=Xanthomonas albilineans TaxID=29447 RepID=UPI0005F34A5D|nr:hypothetical protein [Xanthomonas albilineans]
MTERPVIFNGTMVRAILDGRKTQMRRPMKNQPQPVAVPGLGPVLAIDQPHSPNRWLWPNAREEVVASCPFGKPGDLLWVREAIRLVQDQKIDDGTDALSIYDADGALTAADAWPWKRSYLPAMQCPFGLSRITLEITDVRVERLQAISADDCFEEGVSETNFYDEGEHLQSGGSPIPPERYAFASLWNRSGSDWDANPWVWVISFRRIEQNEQD